MIVRESPELSVIIVNYFSEQKLSRCLRSIDNETERVEVIVADNGSDAAEQETLRSAYPRLVWRAMNGNIGFGSACNAGALLAQSERLLFLNPDTVVRPGALAKLVQALDTPPFSDGILGCAIRDFDGSVQLSCRRFPSWKTSLSGRFSVLTRLFPGNAWSVDYLMKDFDHSNWRKVDWVSGAAMAMRKTVFQELKGFDEGYFVYFEDVDLCKRASVSGVPTFYYPDVVVEHLIGSSSHKVPYRALAYRHQSMWIYYQRHHHRAWLDPFALVGIFGRLGVLSSAQALAQLASALRPVGVGTREPAS